MLRIISILLFLLLLGCTDPNPESSPFKRVPSAHSNVHFSNTITENDVLNILDYEYMYNGGGVGVGDFNSDGLPDIIFTGNMVGSRLYINQGDLTFADATESSGITTDSWCTGVSIVDINNDGKPDIHIATAHDLALGESENYFYINKTEANGSVKFENKAEEMNLADTSYTMQAVWADFDKDGDLDVFLANNSKEEYPKNNPFGQRKDGKGKSTDRLLKNNGFNENGIPVFEDNSAEANITIEGWSLGVTLLDINNDQWPDIYVANDFMSNDILYVNNGDFTFTNKITEYFRHQSHNSMGVDAADINNDGTTDLLVLDMLPEDNLRKKTMFPEIPFDRFNASLNVGYQPQYVRNVLQVRNDNNTFSDVGYYSGIAATDWSWSPLIADFDNDGLNDIYITNGYRKDITDMDFVDFNNSMSTFGTIEARREKLVNQLKKMKGVKKSNFYFKNSGDNRFEEATTVSGLNYPSYSNGAVYTDLDLDGDLDIVTNNIGEEAFIFENRASNSNQGESNYLRLKLDTNVENIGAKVWVFSESGMQFAEFYPQKGYLSSFEPILHFGLGTVELIDSVRVLWPDESERLLRSLKTNQIIEITKENSRTSPKRMNKTKPALFERVQHEGVPKYKHSENSFNDFKKWPLRFRGHSKTGPVIVSGDMNGDYLDDIFIGGTKNRSPLIYLQNSNAGFDSKNEIIVGFDSVPENSGALLFDADEDGDLDLYVANGSSENYSQPDLYQDVLYINNGKGNFSHDYKRLPKITYPTNTILPIDYDRDGDKDLFIGGRLDPNQYPFAPRSYLLNNDKGTFKDVTTAIAPDLWSPGMITDAIVQDINEDGWDDIILVGEWMPIQVFYNQNGRFQLETEANGLEQTHGWWNCIKSADFDGDGDLDFVVGNWGLNNPFKASKSEPLTIYGKDFDDNGTIDPIMTHFISGGEYIMHPRSTLMARLPLIRKYTDSYHDYGSKTFSQLFGKFNFEAKEIFKVFELSSIYIENLGAGMFSYYPLPGKSQWSPIFDFELLDLNDDGKTDVLGVGNFSDNEVLTGYYDAGIGVCLINNGTGSFEALSSKESGFSVPEEARTIIRIESSSKEDLFLVGLQNDSLKLFQKQKVLLPILPSD